MVVFIAVHLKFKTGHLYMIGFKARSLWAMHILQIFPTNGMFFWRLAQLAIY